MNIEVGSYEAKTKLPELLRGVQAGKRYTITLRGEAVAELVPAHDSISTDPVEAVDELLAFMQASKPLGDIDIKALVNEGRS
ncbi:MAG: type II toxin-antitoxin system prevent-host-death family antitoxin [Betaproteobacteria bacterium]